jgi:hypothetical protein
MLALLNASFSEAIGLDLSVERKWKKPMLRNMG